MRHLPASLTAAALLCGPAAAFAENHSLQIDRLVEQNYLRHSVKPNEPIDDAGFIRRVYLDIVGRIPTPEEIAAFESSEGAGRRAKRSSR
ncbi:MAG: DUF1549 domain-containing protein [Verrucomicrobiales bacterium]